MVSIDEIRDRDSLVEWVQWRTPHDAAVLAQRVACRVLPIYGRAMREPWALNAGLTVLPLLRINLTGVATARARPLDLLPSPAPDSAAMKAASRAAKQANATQAEVVPGVTLGAADVAFGSRGDPIKMRGEVAGIAVYAARAVENAETLWAQIRADADTIENGADPSGAPLWSVGTPEWFRRADAEMLSIWAHDQSGGWEFWLRWWEGVLSGRQIDWALQEKVALIPNGVWEAGPEAVAAEIATFEEAGSFSDYGAREAHTATGGYQLVLAQNARVIRLQLCTLMTFVQGEVERLRGRNDLTDIEHEARERRLEMLGKIVEVVALMQGAFDDPANSAGGALVVVERSLPAVVENAMGVADAGGDTQVSAAAISMAATIRHLTEAGTPGNAAAAFAFAELCWGKLKALKKGK